MFASNAKLAAWSADGHTFDPAAVEQYLAHFEEASAATAAALIRFLP
jgi:hypothetical protein